MNHKILRWTLPLAAALAITACGGGGGGGGGGGFFPPPVATTPPPQMPEQPQQPQQSPYDAFISYMKAIVQTALDTSEPADVTAFDPPPVSDVLEPVATQ